MFLKNNQLVFFGKKVENTFFFIDNKYTPATKVCLYDLHIEKRPSGSFFIQFDKTKKGLYKKSTEVFCDFDMSQKVELEKLKGCYVNVTGKSKGKGFQGVVKRYGFSKGPRSHGSSKFHRRPGSICSGETFPARVLKGTKMPGRMGNNIVTIKNLVILDVDDNLIYVKGLVPGSKKSDVRILVNV